MITIQDICNQPCNVESVENLRQQIIESGKGFYTNEEHLARSARVVSLADAEFLYKFTSLVSPKIVIEIGTWFGTTAAIIESVNHCKVYTCDKQDVYCVKNENIFFFNLLSDRFLKKMVKKGIMADMCFIDANLRPGDAEKLVQIVNGPFIIHDYIKGEKGYRAALYLISTKRKFNVLEHNGVAIMETT